MGSNKNNYDNNNNVSLVVKANNINQPVLISSSIPSIKKDEVLVRVEKFGFSTNNITYAALGTNPYFRYFEFFPVPQTQETSNQEYGNIPVWGFGTIVQSNQPKIKVGERIYGYFPMARYVAFLVSPNHIVSECFYASRDHLPRDRKPYNQYYRCAGDSSYIKEREDHIMLYRPLFWTSFWCEDWLSLNKWFNAKTVIITSASSKTSFCLAYLSKRNSINRNSPLHVIGLTSPSNIAFTKSLGMYDEVLSYDQLQTIDKSQGPFIYIDVTGNPKLYQSTLAHLGKENLIKGVSLGMTQHDSATESVGFRGLELFFTPEWMKKRRETTPLDEINRMMSKGWTLLMQNCDKWVKLTEVRGAEAVAKEYKEVSKGKLDPNSGLVFSMWEQNQWPILAKL